MVWVGARGGLEERVAGEAGIEFRAVATGKLRRARNPLRMLTWRNLKDLSRVPAGAMQAHALVRSLQPDVVLGFGGYVAVPVSIAAWTCRRPMLVHEQTVRLGLANRLLARLASITAISSESSLPLLPARARSRAQVVGNPVRAELFDVDVALAVKGLGLEGFDRELPTVYVTGGAQGAAQINTLVRKILPWLLGQANVIHQSGSGGVEQAQAVRAELAPELAA